MTSTARNGGRSRRAATMAGLLVLGTTGSLLPTLAAATAPAATAVVARETGAPVPTGNGGYEAPYFTRGDLSGDDAVTLADLDVAGPALGTADGDAGWADVAAADLDGDGELELRDLADLSRRVMYDDGPFELVEATAVDMQRAMNAGVVTSVELTEAYLDRIAAYDTLVDGTHSRALRSVLATNREAALAAAAASDERRAANGGPRSMVDGIPVLVKDNYNTVDMPTSAGHGSWEANRTATDAHMVAGLRAGGAVILGKASLDEWALGFSSQFSTGVPAGQGVPVANPYALSVTAGGSSGGTGAAIAANLGALGFGSDTGGSIRVPSSYNQLVGVRPTVGLASRDGIVPLALSQDTGGPMTRTAADAAVALDEVVGVDAADPITSEQAGQVPDTYTSYLDPGSLDGARFGFVTSMRGTDAATTRLFDAAVADLRAAGAEVVELTTSVLDPTLNEGSGSTNEFKHDLAGYVEDHLDPTVPTRTLRQIIDSGRLVPGRTSTYTGRDAITPEQYAAWMASHGAAIATGETVTTGLMDDNDLDALIYPSTRAYATQGTNMRLSPNTGMPAVTVPMGRTRSGESNPGAGINLELLGRNYSEGPLLGFAHAYEQATGHRTSPPLYPALEGDAGPGGSDEVGAAPVVGGLTVSADRSAVAVGDEVVVTVAADGVEDLLAYDLTLGFDPDVLSLVDGEVGAAPGGASYERGGDGAVEVGHTRLGSSPGLEGDPVLATLTFEAVAPGESDVAADALEQVGTDLATVDASDLGSATVEVVLRDAPVASDGPEVRGTPEPGRTVTTDGATWDVDGVEEDHQWLLDGEPVAGATGPSYRVTRRDAGRALSVRVTGTAPGTAEGVATSAATVVRRAPTGTRVWGGSPTTVGERPRLRLRVVSEVLIPRGTVDVRYGGVLVRRGVRLDDEGRAEVRLPSRNRAGRYAVAVVLRPAYGFAASRGEHTIRVRRR